MDLVRELGGKTFASRLKRLGDGLQAQATRIYRHHGIEFTDSWFLVAVALSRRDRLGVTELANSLGITHAAVSQIAVAMREAKLITIETDVEDRRRKLLCLSKHGRSTIAELEPIWDAVGRCTDELIASTGQDLLQALTRIEALLEQRSLLDRVNSILPEHSAPEEARP